MSFSNAEKVDILNFYIQCNNNATAAVKLYTELYGNIRTIPTRFTFARIYKNFVLQGNLNKKNINCSRHKKVINENNSTIVLAHLHMNPHTSLRKVSG